MTRANLPDELRRFILTSVPSVPFLEAVLLMRGAPATPWDAALVSRRLYLPERQAGEVLAQLAAGGLAAHDPERPDLFRYRPATPELSARIDSLADAYASDLVGVTDLIHSRIDKRAQQFADAFRLRKDT